MGVRLRTKEIKNGERIVSEEREIERLKQECEMKRLRDEAERKAHEAQESEGRKSITAEYEQTQREDGNERQIDWQGLKDKPEQRVHDKESEFHLMRNHPDLQNACVEGTAAHEMVEPDEGSPQDQREEFVRDWQAHGLTKAQVRGRFRHENTSRSREWTVRQEQEQQPSRSEYQAYFSISIWD